MHFSQSLSHFSTQHTAGICNRSVVINRQCVIVIKTNELLVTWPWRVLSGVTVRVRRTVAVLTVEFSQRLELVDECAVLTLQHHHAHLQTRDVLLLLSPTHTSRLAARTSQTTRPPTRKTHASHTRYRALGPELIPVYRQSPLQVT